MFRLVLSFNCYLAFIQQYFFLNQKKEVDEDLKSSDQTDLKCFSDDDEELNRRAPYIPMSDDLPLFNKDELFFDFDLDSFPILPQS